MKNLFKRKTLKKGDLRNVDVELISLLFDDVKPANGKGVVVKSSEGIGYNHIASSTKFKSTDQGRLHVTVLEPDTMDSQGDKLSAGEVNKAQDHFVLSKGFIGRNDVNHNMNPVDDVQIVESYILKSKDAEHFPDTKIGSWVQVLKCDMESETWKKIKAKSFNGVSIYGKADDTEIQNSNEDLIKELRDIRKAVEATGDKSSLKVIDDKIQTLEKADTGIDGKEIVKALQDMTKILNKAINNSIQSEPGDDKVKTKKVKIAGVEVEVQDYHTKIVEKWAQDGNPENMNILNETNSDQFIDEVLETIDDDTLKEITVTNISKDNKLDAGLIADLILVNELDDEPTAQAIASGEITVTPGILKGEYKLARTTVEAYKDKYGEDAYLAYILKKLGNKSLKALKKLLFKGDRDSETATLAGLDGVIALATDGSDVTNIGKTTYATWAARFTYALKQFGEDYLEHMEKFVIYVSHSDLIDIRSEAQNKVNNLASRLVIDPATAKVTFDGIQIKGRFMTSNYIIMGIPTFIIIGVRTDAEVARRFIPWFWHWYIRLRAGITYVTNYVQVFKLIAGS
jgi:Putative phage serine protease XkdF